jgi:hypothetical protein
MPGPGWYNHADWYNAADYYNSGAIAADITVAESYWKFPPPIRRYREAQQTTKKKDWAQIRKHREEVMLGIVANTLKPAKVAEGLAPIKPVSFTQAFEKAEAKIEPRKKAESARSLKIQQQRAAAPSAKGRTKTPAIEAPKKPDQMAIILLASQ